MYDHDTIHEALRRIQQRLTDDGRREPDWDKGFDAGMGAVTLILTDMLAESITAQHVAEMNGGRTCMPS